MKESYEKEQEKRNIIIANFFTDILNKIKDSYPNAEISPVNYWGVDYAGQFERRQELCIIDNSKLNFIKKLLVKLKIIKPYILMSTKSVYNNVTDIYLYDQSIKSIVQIYAIKYKLEKLLIDDSKIKT